jgi:predicted AAA+ superfamily ATPase
VINSFHDILSEQLRLYYFIGGMPEAVSEYIETKNLNEVRSIQQKILMGYENDFAKHAPKEIVPRIRMVWNGILAQLSKENKKFFYGQIKPGARSKEFEVAIQWLTDAGLFLKVNRINNAKFPLKSYCEQNVFKLFLNDVGLLNAMAGIPPEILIEKNNILTEFKGAFTEQYVCQELFPNYSLYYWAPENARAEVDFVIQKEKEIIPIEVKAEENLKSKSLTVFTEKYKIKKPVRVSMSKFRKESWMENRPLYGVFTL